MPLTIHLHPSERQTAFNLERWRELLADRDLARLPHRIETDRHGHILMRVLVQISKKVGARTRAP